MSRLPIWNPCHPWRALSLGAVLLLQAACRLRRRYRVRSSAQRKRPSSTLILLSWMRWSEAVAALSEAAPDMATELATLAGQQAAMVSDAQVARQQYQRELRTFLKRREALRAENVALTETAAALKAAEANSERLRADYVKRHGGNEAAWTRR